MKTEENLESELGAVAFLDVLGMRGIWQQDTNMLKKLHALIQETIKRSKEISDPYANTIEFQNPRRGQEITKVLSISDTIALFTTGNSEKTIEIQAKICAWLLEYALLQGIPLRGAISYGDYMLKDNITLGYAVDEAASWHEATDWIGVILSPSAQIRANGSELEAITDYAHIPFKQTEKNLTMCVDWDIKDKSKLHKVILSKGPHTPEIAPKYLNTLAFLNRNK
jgi:hypothetical protein